MHKLTGAFLLTTSLACSVHKPIIRPDAPVAHISEAAPVPEPTPVSHDYKVVVGDCLWNITAARGGDPFLWPVLWKANRDQVVDPDLIETGIYLDIPESVDVDETEWAREVAARHPAKKRRHHTAPR